MTYGYSIRKQRYVIIYVDSCWTYSYSMRKQRHVIISVDLSRGYYLNDSHINGKHEHIINFVDPCWT